MADTSYLDAYPTVADTTAPAANADTSYLNDYPEVSADGVSPLDANGKHGGFGAAVTYGVDGSAKGIANTLTKFDKTKDVGEAMGAIANTYADPTYDPALNHFQYSSPSTYGYAPRALTEGIAKGAANIGLGMAGGAIGGAATGGPVGAIVGSAVGGGLGGFASGYGDNLDARMANQPAGATPSTSDQVTAGLSSAAQGAAQAVGPGRLGLNTLVKGLGTDAATTAVGALGKSALIDGGFNAASDIGQQASNTAGTANGLSIDPNEALNAGALGAAGGVASRSAFLPGDAYQTNKFQPFNDDPQATANITARINAAPGDASTPGGAYTSIKDVGAGLNEEISQSKTGAAKPFLSTLSDADAALITRNQARLKSGATLDPNQFAPISDVLSGDADGANLLSLFAQQNTLNRLTDMGVMNDAKGTFGGGFQATKAYDLTNPLNGKTAIAELAGAGLGGGILGGVGGAAVGAGLTAAAPYAIGAVPAIALAARAGMKGFDALSGNANPLSQFLQRTGNAGADNVSHITAPTSSAQGDNFASIVQAANDRATALKAAQTNAAYAQNAAVDPATAQRASEFAKASAQLPPDISASAKAAQMARMWADQQKADAANVSPTGYNQADATDAISQAIAQGGQATDAINAARLAQAQGTDAAWNANTADASTADAQSQARAAQFAKASAQVPQISDAAKAAQMLAAWKAQEASQNAPNDYSASDAQTAIQNELAARAKASQAILANNAANRALQTATASPAPVNAAPVAPSSPIEAAAQNTAKVQAALAALQAPAPVASTPTGNNPAPPIVPGGIADRASANAAAQVAGLPTGDTHTYQGITYPVPPDIGNRPAYVRSLENKQTFIDRQFELAIKKSTSPATQNALESDWMNVKQARNQDNARGFINTIIGETPLADQAMVRATFNDKFYDNWSKAKAS